jgi:hypothetical protein
MWRPGGGNYTDDWLNGLVRKAHQMGRQTELLPAHVVSIQSEVESFPYQRLKKSAHATVLEAAAYIAGGCTGSAFNVLSQYTEPLDEYEPLVITLRQARPFLDRLVQEFGRSRPLGVYSGWVKDSFASRNAASGDWLGPGAQPGTHHGDELLATGIPPAYGPRHASVTVLSGDSVLALDDNAIGGLLAAGVYMDAQALSRLNEMGHQELTGFTVEQVMHDDCIEQLVAHPLNAGFAGRYRNGRQSFWKGPAFALRRTDDKAEMLSRLVDYTYKQVSPCCMGVFENRLGGRICVAGYYPWAQLQNLSKSTQVKSVIRWLSNETLPAYVLSFHRASLWVRRPEPGRLALAVLNAYLDAAEDLTLQLQTDRAKIVVTDMQCRTTTCRARGSDGPYKTFVLPKIGPWQMRLITT